MSNQNNTFQTKKLQDLIVDFSVSYLQKEEDVDVIDFGVDYFSRLQKDRKLESVTGPSALYGPSEEVRPPSMLPIMLSEHGSDASNESDDESGAANQPRKSVFTESYDPETDSAEPEAVFPKTRLQRAHLLQAVKDVLPLRSLEGEQLDQVLDAMYLKRVRPRELIIRQGHDVDKFYVIESGIFKVFEGRKSVSTFQNSGVFGELALLHYMTAKSTVWSQTDGLLWVLERKTFRRVALKSANERRKVYESLLSTVPWLDALKPQERLNLIDAFVSKTYDAADQIIKQGDPADGMYFIESGKVVVKMVENCVEQEIAELEPPKYFGELALVTRRPRCASVYAIGEVKIAFLGMEPFERLLGPLPDVLKRSGNFKEYFLKLTQNCSHV